MGKAAFKKTWMIRACLVSNIFVAKEKILIGLMRLDHQS